MFADSDPLDFAALRRVYQRGATPVEGMDHMHRRIEESGDDHVWTMRRSHGDILADAAALPRDPSGLPLYGIPFAVKDNMDVAGLPTTAACPDYAYAPGRSAPMVERLLAAGAILIGKTNMDQFATGLVGVRSPYGIPRNPYDADMIPGGSSSGSAVAVGAGLVGFALGTDTGGSGRVPAAFNNVVGLKPTPGAVSMWGVVPACRSLDCPAVFAHRIKDASEVADILLGYDANDPYSRMPPDGFSFAAQPPPSTFTFAVPAIEQRRFYGDRGAEAAFDAAIDRMAALGGRAMEIDFAPLASVGDLFYKIWLAERVADLGGFIDSNPDSVNPIVFSMLQKARQVDGVGVFRAQHHLAAIHHLVADMWRKADFLLVPTTGTAYSIHQVLTEPLERNAQLGYYANFANLLDMAALAVPNGFNEKGFPRGVTLLGPAWSDAQIAAYGASFVALTAEIG